ncbi:MAG: tRNA dihydrouridine(20/20a) synthase DusA [Alphaproteobacteria bacterium]|nr:tRNA dihydrouridine(20/20a) synthase DusA [Alphaproteobacteria bacterium]MBU1563309.1 tRNA dihydrouridine(20/20a) synthase DusA [Alphaproteobacteria bacterium]MBU2302032.1 tRNA dihydrouridine(20/20a) synthase DusA [Alphaproteobacteria bacterium]MBU2367288.1 tRNA dihydrouridine(20/20a) synthase DusA [Alphaproteobacteria bacterium]
MLQSPRNDADAVKRARRFSVAPMMDWTDRHCRYLHRLLTREALLFTEMVTSAAIVHGDAQRHLRFDPVEQPVALQLGGSDPAELARATGLAHDAGYAEINLNVGCPSDRVQSGRFGACLMAEPDLVAECVRAMRDATDRPVTVKCRIGIDDQDTEQSLDRFADTMVAAGVDALYVHARKAWLKGLSPKENRTIPPLDYDRVHRLRARLTPLPVMLNGGLESLEAAEAEMAHVDGVMLGRAAYHTPMLLAEVDRRFFGATAEPVTLEAIMHAMADYADREAGQGTRLNNIARHMLGLANGLPGARQFRQILSVDACRPGADSAVMFRALEAVNRPRLAEAG